VGTTAADKYFDLGALQMGHDLDEVICSSFPFFHSSLPLIPNGRGKRAGESWRQQIWVSFRRES